MKPIGILQFPGSNCDRDAKGWVEAKGFLGQFLWHSNHFSPMDFEAFILPGGFSYGDYLRSGALAAQSQAVESLREAIAKGVPVLGICNGFQVLCEARLLPGTLVQNEGRRFIDRWVDLQLVHSSQYFLKSSTQNRFRIPIAHGDGRYFVSTEDLKKIEDQGQIWFRYVKNPNGSVSDVAGVMSENKKVCGLMPHPERAIFDWMGGVDGWNFLGS